MTRSLARALVITILVAGCSGAPLPDDLSRPQALERGGDDRAALAAWRTIREQCETGRIRPHDDCGLAATREAQLLERTGDDRAAADAWERVPARTSDPRKAARALARAAELADEKLAAPDRAIALAWRCVERYPDEVPADDALALLVRRLRARDPRALRERLDAIAAHLRNEDLADNVLFASAEVTAAELADPRGAVARYDELARRFERSPLLDDANYRAAGLLRAAGDPRGAIVRLERITRTRRTALIVGSYNAPLLDDAQLLVGQIRRDDLHDPDGAIAAFTTLADEFRDSLLRDDALYEVARTHVGRHTPPESRDRLLACTALSRLLRQFPDGNRVHDARTLQHDLSCSP